MGRVRRIAQDVDVVGPRLFKCFDWEMQAVTVDNKNALFAVWSTRLGIGVEDLHPLDPNGVVPYPLSDMPGL